MFVSYEIDLKAYQKYLDREDLMKIFIQKSLKKSLQKLQRLTYLVLPLMLVPVSSFALFEARVTFGPAMTSGDPVSDICNGNAACTGALPGKLALPFTGADVLIKLPLIPFGFGLRYEKLSATGSSANMSATADFNRTAILLNYRLIDTILHVGPIFSYGISHSGSLSMSQNGTKVLDYSSAKGSSYSLGIEAGIKPLIVIPISIGVEAGLTQFKYTNATDSLGSTPKDIDLSGNYLKVFLGLDI